MNNKNHEIILNDSLKKLTQLETINSIIKKNDGINKSIMISVEELVPNSLSDLAPILTFTSDFSHINKEYALEGLINSFTIITDNILEVINEIDKFYVIPPNRLTNIIPLQTNISIEEFTTNYSTNITELRIVINSILENVF